MVEDFSTQFNVLYLHTKARAGSPGYPVYIAIVLASTGNLHRAFPIYSRNSRSSNINGNAELNCYEINDSTDGRQVRGSVPLLLQ